MKQLGIRQQILLMTLLPVLTVAALLGLYILHNYLVEVNVHQQQRAATSSRLLAIYADTALSTQQFESLQPLVSNALEEPGVRAVRILDQARRVLAHAGPEMPELPQFYGERSNSVVTDSYLRFVRPIYSGDSVGSQLMAPRQRKLLGWVDMEYHRSGYTITKYQTFFGSSFAIVLAALLAIALASRSYRQIARNVNSLRQSVQAFSRGFLDTHFQIDGNNELKPLASDLNTMTAAVKKAFQELQSNIEQSNTDLRETMETLEVQNIELDLARREALEASRIKSEFLANTSHEIRTPLNGIIGFANILLKSETDPRRRESLDVIRASADSLLTIINDLLDFSKLEAGKLALDQIPVNLREVAEDALGMLSPSANDKNLELALFVDKDLPDALIADPLRIKQAITNLLSNAIKFTQEGHVRLGISINSLSDQQANITITVTDSGIGLSEQQQRKLFKPFTQADASTSRRFGGTGLGLVIVKRLVEQMGGEVGVNSQPNDGATFWFRLSLPIVANAVPARQFDQLAGIRVGIYDKRAMSRQALQELLTNWQIQVSTYTSSSELLENEESCDLMILGLDQSEAQVLPQRLDECNLPVIILSPTLDGVAASEYYRCLTKPPPQARLFDAITEVLARNGNAPPRVSSALPAAVGMSFPQLRVLVVDDNSANRTMMTLLLEEFGITPATADGGEKAIALCQEQLFDVIFLDLQMPDMDGIEVAAHIREQTQCQRSRLIALSAYLAPENPRQLREQGFSRYCSKPLSSEQLGSMLRELVTDGESTGHINIATTMVQASTARPVDLRECVQIARGNNAVAHQMLAMLLGGISETCEKLQHAHDNNDLAGLREQIHSLRGACCYVGVPPLKHAVDKLDALLGSQPAASSPDEIKTLVNDVLAALKELEQWRDQHDLETLFELEN